MDVRLLRLRTVIQLPTQFTQLVLTGRMLKAVHLPPFKILPVSHPVATQRHQKRREGPRRAEIGHVYERFRRHERRIVAATHHHSNDVVSEHLKHLLRDVIFADAVFESQIEIVATC